MTDPTGTSSTTHEADLPYAAQLLQEASRNPAAVVVVGPRSNAPLRRLQALLAGRLRIAAVVPARSPARPADRWAFDTMTPPPSMALRAATLTSSGLDPETDSVSAVVDVLTARLVSTGERIVSEPTWTSAVPFDPVPSLGTCSKMLIVTEGISSGVLDAKLKASWELVADLSRLLRRCDLTLASLERVRRPEDARLLRSIGIRVIDGRVDWEEVFANVSRDLSHVLVTAEAATESSVLDWIDVKAPGAYRILYKAGPFAHELMGEETLAPTGELPALLYYRRAVDDIGGRLVRWADHVWCHYASDADTYTASFPGQAVRHVPAALSWEPEPGRRRSPVIALVAADGADVDAGHEDAARRGLQMVLPRVRRALPDVECVVVTDYATPELEGAIAEAKARVAPVSDLHTVLGSARVVLVPHAQGPGQPSIVLEAVSRGTPVVATSAGRAEATLGPLEALAVRNSDGDMATIVRRLLTDQASWDSFVEAECQLVIRDFDPHVRGLVVEEGLASAGLAIAGPETGFPADGHRGEASRAKPPTPPPPRPPGSRLPTDEEPDVPSDPVLRYQLWIDRWGATAENRRSLAEDLSKLAYRPLISLLMAVDDTPAAFLEATFGSLRDQIYGHWELCATNNGSSDPATLAALDSIRADSRVKVVDLPERQAIPAALSVALTSSSGDFVAFVGSEDLLKPHTLGQVVRWLNADPQFDLVYTDEDKLGADGSLVDPDPKPDWSPDQLMVHNYVGRLAVVRRDLLVEVGGIRAEMAAGAEHDLLLRVVEHSDRIGHIPEPLYTRRTVKLPLGRGLDDKAPRLESSCRAISNALVRRGYEGHVSDTAFPGYFRPRYEIPGRPRVSIIIPTRDQLWLLERCVDSILERSTYEHYEVVVVDNDSRDGKTLEYLADLPGRVIRYPYDFNYARMMNLAARSVASEALLFLNNDTEVISPDWIEALLELASKPEVGATGARLYYPDGKPQHEGIVVGSLGVWAGNLDFGGFGNRGALIRNTTAVTGACMMIRPSVFWRMGGFDEQLRVALNDVDLCLRIRQAGFEVVYTPFAELYHHEGASRSGREHPEDRTLFGARWNPGRRPDPYYNPLLSDRRPFSIKL